LLDEDESFEINSFDDRVKIAEIPKAREFNQDNLFAKLEINEARKEANKEIRMQKQFMCCYQGQI
jgi:hypothetical protein